MGITLYYNGRLKSPKLIDKIVDEIEDVCKSMEWSGERSEFEITVPENYRLPPELEVKPGEKFKVRGIIVRPGNRCDPVCFLFEKQGYLVRSLALDIIRCAAVELPMEDVGWEYCKTQFAGYEVHMALVKFLKYLGDKYFDNFEGRDDSEYWETGDEKHCKDTFEGMGAAIDLFHGLMSRLDNDLGNRDNFATGGVVDKIVELLKKRFDEEDSKGF